MGNTGFPSSEDLQNRTESDMIKSNRLKQGRYFIMNCNITVIPGDGIGPEIVREACGVLDKVGRRLRSYI